MKIGSPPLDLTKSRRSSMSFGTIWCITLKTFRGAYIASIWIMFSTNNAYENIIRMLSPNTPRTNSVHCIAHASGSSILWSAFLINIRHQISRSTLFSALKLALINYAKLSTSSKLGVLTVTWSYGRNAISFYTITACSSSRHVRKRFPCLCFLIQATISIYFSNLSRSDML